MTDREMRATINKTARNIKKAGNALEINYSIPYVAFNGEMSFFFQGEEAENLLEEATTASNKFQTTLENTLFWMASSW